MFSSIHQSLQSLSLLHAELLALFFSPLFSPHYPLHTRVKAWLGFIQLLSAGPEKHGKDSSHHEDPGDHKPFNEEFKSSNCEAKLHFSFLSPSF